MIGLSKQELDDMFLQSFMDIHNQRKADIHNQNPYPNIPKQLADLTSLSLFGLQTNKFKSKKPKIHQQNISIVINLRINEMELL